MPLKVTASTASAALRRAQARGVLPLALSSVEIRAELAREIRMMSVFSSRTTNARYLQEVRDIVARLLQGGFQNDLAQLRLELKRLIAQLGYTPETGFPGDEALGIPPAEPGSLQDLSSDRRLNLLLTTQEQLMRGAAQKVRGEDGSRLTQFPAWELVRIGQRSIPRGSPDSGTKGWPARFIEAGGELRTDERGKERLIALKGAEVWELLGDSAIFSDALDVNHPPFAFNSGMGWVEVHHREAKKLGLSEPPATVSEVKAKEILPAPRASADGLDPDTITALKKQVKGLEAKDGDLMMKTRRESEDVLQRRLARIAKTGKAYATEEAP